MTEKQYEKYGHLIGYDLETINRFKKNIVYIDGIKSTKFIVDKETRCWFVILGLY